jgi:phosphoribosylformylglycinamidine cyclo-ligase
MNDQRRQSGLDLDLGDQCSAIAYGWAKRTFPTRLGKTGLPVLQVDGSFCNLMDFGDLRIAICSDGIGTKVEVAERTRRYDTLGHDLVAMVVDDLAANGVEPVNVSNILDVDHLDADVVDQLMRGLHEAARVAGVAVVGGEIAELGSRVRGWGDGMHFNWCATAIGVLPRGIDPIDGTRVAPGDLVVALRSRGFRSNGFSLARRVLEADLGPDWHDHTWDGEVTWGQVMLTPSRIYSPGVQALIASGYVPHGIAHVTGGGIPGNLERVLEPNGLGARLDRLFPPHDFMTDLIRRGGVEPRDAYRMFNMGTGMLLVVAADDAERCVALLRERRYEAQVAGVVTQRPGITVIDPLGGGEPCMFDGGR